MIIICQLICIAPLTNAEFVDVIGWCHYAILTGAFATKQVDILNGI